MERQIQEFGRTERFGADSRFPAIAIRPVRHRHFLFAQHQVLADSRDFHLLSLRNKDGQLRPQGFADVFEHGCHDGFHVNRGRQVAAQVVQTFGVNLALPHDFRAFPGLYHQGADDYADDEETEKSKNIFGILHRETPSGGDEKEIKGQNP